MSGPDSTGSQIPEDTVVRLTQVVKPKDVLGQLNRLARKAIGENLASTQARQDVEEARAIIGRQHKLSNRQYSWARPETLIMFR